MPTGRLQLQELVATRSSSCNRSAVGCIIQVVWCMCRDFFLEMPNGWIQGFCNDEPVLHSQSGHRPCHYIRCKAHIYMVDRPPMHTPDQISLPRPSWLLAPQLPFLASLRRLSRVCPLQMHEELNSHQHVIGLQILEGAQSLRGR